MREWAMELENQEVMSLNEVFKSIDRMPEFDWRGVNIYKAQENRGPIPLLFGWFEPRDDEGKAGSRGVWKVQRSDDYKKWGLGERIDKLSDYWKK